VVVRGNGPGTIVLRIVSDGTGGGLADSSRAGGVRLYDCDGGVRVTGTEPFTYQWYYNGKPIEKSGQITTIAGLGPNETGDASGFSGDGGPAIQAQLDYPQSITTDPQGNVYFNDTFNYRVRKIDANNIISTIAGNGLYGTSGDGGPATSASFTSLSGIAVGSAGGVYVSDAWIYTNQNTCGYIRVISSNGLITTIAGNGTSSWAGDGLQALQTGINPTGLAVDASNNLYVFDSDNYRVERIDTNGVIVSVVGTGAWGYSGDGGPATNAAIGSISGIALDAQGNLYLADRENLSVRKVDANGIISIVAGNGYYGYASDGSAATNTALGSLTGIALDTKGNIYFGDAYYDERNSSNHYRILKIDTNGILSTVAGGGSHGEETFSGAATNAFIWQISDIAVDSQNHLFFTDESTIRQVNLAGIDNAATNGGTLTLSGVSSNDLGNYTVVVTSDWGSVTSSVISLAVAQPPTLASALSDQRIAVSNNVTFAVVATGSSPLSYKWSKDGKTLTNSARITGATNATLTLNAVSSLDEGAYSCLVTGANGSVTSSAATLTVSGSPPFLTATLVGQKVVITWAGSYPLLSATNVTGPYTVVTGATSPYTNNPPSASRRFFGLGL